MKILSKFLDYGGSDSQPFLVMEYVNGTTLQKILENP
jgi:serine/threonine protein kinase